MNDGLKNTYKLQHTGRRSVNNFMANTISTFCANAFFPKKTVLEYRLWNNNNQFTFSSLNRTHFKYIKTGAKQIISSASRDKLLTTAYLNPKSKIAVVVMNATDVKMPYSLWVKGKTATTSSLPYSIITLIIN